jgi:hypothetical protein
MDSADRDLIASQVLDATLKAQAQFEEKKRRAMNKISDMDKKDTSH